MRVRKPILASLIFLLPACASPGGEDYRQGVADLALANYETAFYHLDRAHREAPDDAELTRRWQEATVLYRIDRARSLLQTGEEEQALALLGAVLLDRPDDSIASTWVKKALVKLTRRKLGEAEDLLARGKHEAAVERLEEVLLLKPGHERAGQLLLEVHERAERKRHKAERQYQQALGAWEFQHFRRVVYHCMGCIENDPTREDAKRLLRAGQRQLADEIREKAQVQKRGKAWRASSSSFMQALDLAKKTGLDWADSMIPLAKEMEEESRAAIIMDDVVIKVGGGKFKTARELLALADPICRYDRMRLNRLHFRLNQEEISKLSLRGRTKRLDHRFLEALAIYKEILERGAGGEAEDWIENIENILDDCDALYQEALEHEKKGATNEAEKLFKRINYLNRRYKDVAERLGL